MELHVVVTCAKTIDAFVKYKIAHSTHCKIIDGVLSVQVCSEIITDKL